MSQSAKTWLRAQNKIVSRKSISELSSEYCFRDPIRPIKNNSEIFFSPADGIIIDIANVIGVDDNLYSKYGDITLRELTYDMIPEESYHVVTIFLTFYDAHIIRIPISGVISLVELSPIFVQNRPMLDFEEMLLHDFSKIKKEKVCQFAFNQRILCQVKNPFLASDCYLLMTADYDIDSILPFSISKKPYFSQNSRIATIRYGSMVTCIIPEKLGISSVCKEFTHVEAGLDPLFEFTSEKYGFI